MTQPTSTHEHLIREAALNLLRQCAQMLHATRDAAYARDSATLAGGTIGKHLRHTLDHYAAALHPADGFIQYDRRRRDVPMETDRAAALSAIDALMRDLSALPAGFADAPVRVLAMIDASGYEAQLTSTLGRELAFATHHAIHHQAMMKAIAREHDADLGRSLGHAFGTAPSTLHHEAHPAPHAASTQSPHAQPTIVTTLHSNSPQHSSPAHHSSPSLHPPRTTPA